MDDFLKGGAHELSGVLEAEVKKEPDRFAKLALRLPANTNPSYFDAVLRGVADASVETETLLELCRKCHSVPDRPCGRWLCDAIGKAAGRKLPTELLEMVSWYATEHPDPEEELWRVNSASGTPYYGGDPFLFGMNSTRGRAALALGDLISGDKARVPILQETLERIVEDPSVAVRSCAAQTLIAVLIHDRDLAVRLFIPLCDGDAALLGTQRVERFLQYATWTHFPELEFPVKRMIDSTDADTVVAGARIACLAALEVEEATSLANTCLEGDKSSRTSASQVYAANLATARYREVCEDGLMALFDDESEEVRREAARCFFWLKDDELGDYRELVESFVGSRAFDTEHWQLLDALERTTSKLPDSACQVCERFLDVAGTDAANIQLSSFGHADTAVQVLARAYNQNGDPAVLNRCLNIFDRMAELGIYQVSRALEQYER